MQTVLPPLGFTNDVHAMCRNGLMQLLMHIWGLYQALIANYRELRAQNMRLQYIASSATKRAADAEQRAADAEQRAADAEQRAADAEQRAADAESSSAYWQRFAQQSEQELCAREQQEAAEAEILFELGNDPSWTSVSKVNFVGKQTKAVLKAKMETAQKQAELDELKNSIAKLAEGLPFDDIEQEPVKYPVIVVPSDPKLDAKIVNKGSAMNLNDNMNDKFPTGHGATIQGTYECADVKRMYERIFELLKLCSHKLDE